MTNLNIVVIGSSGAIGSAFVSLLLKEPSNKVYAFSRSPMAYQAPNLFCGYMNFLDESSISAAAEQASQNGPIDIVLVTTGILHSDSLAPEKSLRDLSASQFEQSFCINTIGPALVAKHFLPKLHRNKRAIFAALSARVGSISDNRLGGWYAYRASKAALNMLIKTCSIEIYRSRKLAIVVALHPGTVASKLSKPFQRNVPKAKLFDASYAATQLLAVLNTLTPEDSGKLFAWDGSEISF